MLSIYLVIGAFAGVMSGLFGIGGGIIVIPALSAIFMHENIFPQSMVMQMAVGTSLATMIVTSASALYNHHKQGVVRWIVFQMMLPFLAIGAFFGSIVAHFVSSYFLQILFGLFLLVVGTRLVINTEAKESNRMVAKKWMRISSVFIGGISSLLGVGGGTVIVPFLLRCGLDMREAIGTSLVCGLIIGIVATFCFMVAGVFNGIHVPASTGYIYWPGFLGIGIASTLFTPLGTKLSHKLPIKWLKRIFGVLLLLMASDMLFYN